MDSISDVVVAIRGENSKVRLFGFCREGGLLRSLACAFAGDGYGLRNSLPVFRGK